MRGPRRQWEGIVTVYQMRMPRQRVKEAKCVSTQELGQTCARTWLPAHSPALCGQCHMSHMKLQLPGPQA